MSTAPQWDTSSFGESAQARAVELEALHQHLRQCSQHSGRVVALHCGWLGVQAFVLSRLVTTLAIVVIGAACALTLI
jgi:hypothetical protein